MEASHLVQVHERYRSKGVEFVGLTHEGASARLKSEGFLKDNKITWVNGYGANATVDRLGVEGFPTTFVVGKNGRVYWSEAGAGLEGVLERAIEEALAAES